MRLARRWPLMVALRLAVGFLSVAISAALSAATSAAIAADIELRDDRGDAHHFAAPPQRIVTMLPSLTELAWVLGIGGKLVGVDRYSNWPPEVANLPHLGGLDDAQIEAIAALKPDVILASTSSRAMQRLEALGFTVMRFKSDNHADLRRTLATLSGLLGRPEAGAALWSDLQRQLDVAAARVPLSLRGQRVYFEVGGGPYAAGPASSIGETLARLGLGNIVPATLGAFPKLNPEFVVRARPDVIMGEARELATMANRPGWRALAAVREQRLCAFSPEQYDVLVRPGPRLGEAAQLLADCLTRLAAATRPAISTTPGVAAAVAGHGIAPIPARPPTSP